MSLRIKLTLAFLLLGALVAGISYFQIVSIIRVGQTFSHIVEQDIPLVGSIQDIEAHTFKIDATASKPATPENTARLQAHIQGLAEARSQFQKYAGEIEPKLRDDILAHIDKVIASTEAFYLPGTTLTAKQLADMRAALARDQEALLSLTAGLDDGQRFTTQGKDVEDTISRTVSILILSAILAIVVAITLGLMVAIRLSRQMGKLRTGAQHIANGNLSELITVKSKDEIGQLAESFNQMSTRLRESYHRLAIESQRDVAMLQGMGEGLIAIDEEAKVVLLNPVTAAILEIDEKTAIGKSVYSLFNLLDKKDQPLNPQNTPMHFALQTGIKTSEVFGFIKQDKRKILISVNASPITLDKKVVGVVLILRDVTKEREIDRMKTEFISLASHQLRTPLSAIKWFSEMLLSGDAGKLKPDQADFAKNIADSTERMIQLVNSLLNISRIESGRIMVTPQPTDLKELVTGIINDLKGKTEEKKQSLIVSVHGEMPKINLDPRLIGQVYLNLLTNAIKYTPKGGEISVFISIKGDQVISQVTDNGYGIPKDQQSRLFQKFFRATNAVKIETDGTGLGLYLIKAVIESSGGKIWFESDEGKGSTFWFTIPLSGMQAKEGEVTLDA